MVTKLNIYGDNILECEEALRLISSSLELELVPIDGPLYVPKFSLSNSEIRYEIQLFPGYDRWDYDIKTVLEVNGAKLREATDAIVTKQYEKNGLQIEKPILSMEFCGALPAGNNAWQRSGRAISSAQAKIPYLYFAELGGIELDSDRNTKAARFPNPIIPFSYLSLGKRYSTITLPIYSPSPSISADLYKKYSRFFAGKELQLFIKAILENDNYSSYAESLANKALELTLFLASQRKNKGGILQDNEWKKLLNFDKGSQIADLLIDKRIPWNKRVSIPTSNSFKKLLSSVSNNKAVAVCSGDLPFCLLSTTERHKLGQLVATIYRSKVDAESINWIKNGEKPLFIAWVAGFKPRGDDSRPDRGLVPLLRMVTGENDVDVLTIIYGPCPTTTLKEVTGNIWKLAQTNGLWQAVLNYSNAIIVDTKTTERSDKVMYVIPTKYEKHLQAGLDKPINTFMPKKFGEHDVDSVLHEIFYLHKDETFFEGLCNPPGGNWSGISIFNFEDGTEYRWVSLPRVSGTLSKRPDHIFQIKHSNNQVYILSIESKDTSVSLETDIGSRLIKYVKELTRTGPNVYREKDEVSWRVFDKEYKEKEQKIFSVAAFRYTKYEDMNIANSKSNSDVIVGVEFIENGQVHLHIKTKESAKWLESFLQNRVRHFGNWLKVEVH